MSLKIKKRKAYAIGSFVMLSLALIFTVGVTVGHIGMPNSVVHAEDSTPTDEKYFTFNTSTGTITGYDDLGPRDVVIPKTIQGVNVTTIGSGSFGGCELTSLALPDGLIDIQQYAFAANEFSTITIPDSVKTIGYEAFYLGQLSQVVIGNGVEELNGGAFSNNVINNITFGSSIKKISNGAFSSNALTELILPNTLEELSNGAFSDNNLASVSTPDSVLNMYGNPFNGNPLTSVNIGTPLYTGEPHMNIYGGAFNYLPLKTVVFGNSVKSVSSGAFANNQIDSIDFGQSIQTIISGAFIKNKLTSISTPDSLLNMSGNPFEDNPLTSANIGKSSYTGEVHTVLSNSTLTNLPLKTLTFGNSVKTVSEGAFADNQIDSIDFGQSIQVIGNSAFVNNKISSISLPDSLLKIEGGPFWYNPLTTVNIGTKEFTGAAHMVIDQGAFEGSRFGRPIQTVVLGNSVKSIGIGAFAYNQISSLDLGKSVEVIEAGAFEMNNIVELSTPDSLVLIVTGAFANNKLETVDIGTKNYKGIVRTVVAAGAFGYNNKVQAVSLGNSVKSLPDGAFSGNQITSLDLGKSIETIGVAAFGSNSLTSVLIPESLKSIGVGAFANNKINSLNLGKSVETIESGAFDENELTSVTIPSSTKALYSAFRNNPLKSVTIGTDPFSGLPGLVLKKGAFSGCWSENTYGVQSLVIGRAVRVIENGAFTCNSLMSLKIDSNPTFGDGVFAFNGLDRSSVPTGLTNAAMYEYYKNNAELVKIYASDPSFAYKSEYYYSHETNLAGYDTYSDAYLAPIVSGTIVNPASYTAYYQTDENVSLVKPRTYISKNLLTNYKLTNTLNVTNPTSPSLSFEPYYKVGDVISLTIPSFSGYLSPDRSQVVLSLNADDNNNKLIYTYIDVNKSVPGVPNTGQRDIVTNNPMAIAALGILAVITLLVARRRVR